MTILKIKIFFAVLIVLCLSCNAQQRCRNVPDGNKFPMPEPASYVVCRNQQEFLQHCRSGFEFDPFVRECNLTMTPSNNNAPPQRAPPVRNSVTTTTLPPRRPLPRPGVNSVRQFDSSTTNPCSNQRDGTYLIDATNRNRFFYCLNGQAIAGNCPDSQHFNVSTASCELPRSVARPASPPRNRPPAPPRDSDDSQSVASPPSRSRPVPRMQPLVFNV